MDWAGSWAWEIGGAVFSVICVGLLMGFLGTVNGMPYAKYQYSVSPNAVVSIITMCIKGAMLILVSSCLGQVKWKQGQQQKPFPLYNFHVLDQASRGPWGAMEVFLRVRSILAIAGAILMVLSVAIDPFSQQILAFPSRQVLASNLTASVQSTQEYQQEWTNHPFPQNSVGPSMLSAIMAGLGGINRPLVPQCPAVNCTYPDFASLGVCSNCEDITKNAVQTCRPITDKNSSIWKDVTIYGDRYRSTPFNCTYSFPNGFSFFPPITYLASPSIDTVEVARQTFNLLSVGDHSTRDLVSFLSARFSRKLIYTSHNASAVDDIPTMTNCTVYLCEKEYTGNRISNEAQNVRPSRSQRLVPKIESGKGQNVLPLLPEHGANTFSTHASYRIELLALESLWSTIESMFDTNVKQSDGENIISALQSSAIFWIGDNLTQSVDAMATSMTDHMRLIDKANAVQGLAYRTETYIHVRWPWAIAPVIAVVLSNLLFIATVWANRGQPILWKSSVFPLLLGRLHTSADYDFFGLHRLDDWQAMSRKVNIIVEEKQEGINFTER
ncbi:hypothetical protein EYZ11_007195 [Aspergillus tanneri]|nr:hypothetical protein EYZ11_007195 [Aspergillus tanneri]